MNTLFLHLPRRPQRAVKTSAMLALVAFGITGIRAQNSAVNLDGIARGVIAQERVVGASVLVARDNKIVLEKGYGFADFGLEAPTKSDTVYRVVGPMMP